MEDYNPYAGVYKRAVELFKNGEYPEAFIKLYSVVENDKENYLANYYIGECYFKGLGCEVNYERAFKNYSAAAMKQHVDALYMVGYCYETGLGVEKEETQAVTWYMEASKKDQVDAEYRLGLCYKNGIGIEKNIPLAATWFLRVAQKGMVDAQREAAMCYEILNQPVATATLYLAAADQDDAYSCEKIASFYEKGYGCPQSIELALFYYQKAGDLGNEAAILRLAQIYKNGDGVEASIKTAIFWWLKVVESSDEAQMELANCYLSGNGVLQNSTQGMKWLKRAASKNPEAMLKMAEYSLNPILDDDKSEVEAKLWWTKAASLGNSLAMYKLGVCYEDGIGMSIPDLNEAYKWYHLASQKGNEDATEACKRFTKNLFGNVKVKKR